MQTFISLFKALPITKNGKKEANKKLLKETIKSGFIYAPEVIYNYDTDFLIKIIPMIEETIGFNSRKINNTFHKSWRKIKETNIEVLVIEQIMHYITTYGFEALGVYDNNSVYIPCEKLELPRINLDKIPLTVIKGYTIEELKEKVFAVLKSGIALKDDTKIGMVNLIKQLFNFSEDELVQIKNKEVRVVLYDSLNKIPKNPIEFLRFVIFKSIGRTLLIKDPNTISEIKVSMTITKDIVYKLFKKYDKEFGIEHLGEIFYRFKPLFLAFKRSEEMNNIINRIRRLAVRFHKPMPEDFLNSVTSKIKNDTLDLEILEKELKKVNVFRKIRLVYSVKFRESEPSYILYRIRNGKNFVTDFNELSSKKHQDALNIILKSISENLRQKVAGKNIYIPKNITYSLPATEKQFVGNFPSGTCISVPNNMIFGIHWNDVGENRIDLDLSLINHLGDKIGWDGRYRNQNLTVLFSGDMTSATPPNGATELFHVNKNSSICSIMFVNYYNFNEKVEVPFKIIVGRDVRENLSRNYMISPNNVISSDSAKISTRQKIIGLMVTNEKECKFYYVETSFGDSITSRATKSTNKIRQFLFDFNFGSITLNEVLEKSGAILVDSKEDCDIDLSPESLEKDTIINLIS